MKVIFKSRLMAGAIVLAMCAGNAQAQEYKTNESIRTQIVNNTVPGAKYGPVKAAPVARAKDPNRGKETSGMQLKKGNVPGMQFAKGGAASPKKAVAVNNDATAKTLPSASPAKVSAEKKIPAAVPVPTQEVPKTEKIKN